MKWVIAPLVADDLLLAEEWYGQQRSELAAVFQQEFQSVLDSISLFPSNFQQVMNLEFDCRGELPN